MRTNDVVCLSEKRLLQRVIVIRFPTKEALECCFASEEYKQIMMKRVHSVDSRTIIVHGLEESDYENSPD